jgi:molybdate-binding protein/DNA-binding transcriptional regulator YhcF (GntR family)
MTAGESFVYLEIAEAIRRSVFSGELQAGARLPSVRSMAQRWGCTPNTVARAYAQLSKEGLVSAHRGGGTRVVSRPEGFGPAAPREWEWANLVNRAESYLLDALNLGHSPAHAEAALAAAIARWQELRRHPTPRGAAREDARLEHGEGMVRLRFAGSHDLSVELLARFLSERPAPVTMTTDYVGSLGGLMALARGEAEVAGSHLWDESTHTFNVAFVQRVFPGREVVLINLVQRLQGLIVPAGNPQGLTGLVDLNRPGVVFVNRQPGSGTRVWLDTQLRRAGLAAEDITGYGSEESTHVGVARAIDEGRATAGLGIGAAAAAYGLDFIPLFKERYDLVVLEEHHELPGVRAIRSVLVMEDFREAVAALGGYDLSDAGREVRLG